MRLVLILAALWAGAPMAALAEGLRVQDAFALISPAGQSGAAFMRLENAGPEDDRLVAVTADIARRVELHTHTETTDGVMRMIAVEEGFALPAGSEHRLERGGDHVMFLGLRRVPAEGEDIPLTLIFESGAEITLDIPVRAPMAAGGHGHDHGNHGHD